MNIPLLGLPMFLSGAGAIGFAAIMIIVALGCFLATYPKDRSVRSTTVRIGVAFLLAGIVGPIVLGDAVVIVAVIIIFIAIVVKP